MKRLILLLSLALVACAPVQTGSAPITSSAPLVTAFSDAGVLWSQNGRAYIALPPDFRAQAVGLPAPAGPVGWQIPSLGSPVPWVSVPAYGLIVTAVGAPQSVQVGAAAALTSHRVYRADGTAVGYDGSAATGLPGSPGGAVSGGDGQEYGVVRGQLYQVGATLPLSTAQAFLYATPTGADTAGLPTLATAQGRYQLTGRELVYADPAGAVRTQAPDSGVALGLVSGRIAVLEPDGRLHFYNEGLNR